MDAEKRKKLGCILKRTVRARGEREKDEKVSHRYLPIAMRGTVKNGFQSLQAWNYQNGRGKLKEFCEG